MSKRTIKIFITALLMMLITSGLFGFMLYRVMGQGEKLVKQIETIEVEQTQEDSFLKLKRIFEETTADRAKLLEYFILNDSDSILFLTEVESLAPQMGLSIKTSSLNTITDSNKNKWLDVTFEFSGSVERVETFIKTLESLPYVLRLTSVSMKSLSSSEWQASVKMQIQILSYDAPK